MRSGAACCLLALIIVLPCPATTPDDPAATTAVNPAASTGTDTVERSPGYVRLKLEEYTTLHVGQVAVLMMPSRERYGIETAGKVLVPIERKPQERPIIYLYRAVRPGNETMLLSRLKPGRDGCISCATQHYFITVVP